MYIYDSLYSTAPIELQQQIAALLHTKDESITMKFGKVSLQTNGSDCGVYAIAFVAALCLGKSPQRVLFDDSKMRQHLMKCLEDGCFTMFPVRQNRRQAEIKATRQISIHCSCRMPNIPGVEMIECTACQQWFHVYCAAPAQSVVIFAELSWFCEYCI